MKLCFVLAFIAIFSGCETIAGNHEGSTSYTVNLSISFGGAYGDHVQVCVKDSINNETCGPNGGFARGTAQISLKADPGMSYTVIIPPNQPMSPYCAVSSGSAGVYGPTMPTAVVSCS